MSLSDMSTILSHNHQDQSTKSYPAIQIIQIITIYNVGIRRCQPIVSISIPIPIIINQCQTLTQSSHIWNNRQCNSRHSKIINNSNHAILALEFRLWIFNRHFSKSCSQTYPTPLLFCLTKWFVFKQAHQQ